MRLHMQRRIALIALLLLVSTLSSARPVRADVPTFVEFPLNPWAIQPRLIMRGPDNAMWFVEAVSDGRTYLARMTLAGTVTNEFYIPGGISAMTSGPDGNIWFTQPGNVGKITLQGAMTLYPISPTSAEMRGITTGADGNLWITDMSLNQIIRVSPAGAVIGLFPIPTPDSRPHEIVAGPDSNLWFVENVGGNVGRITSAGVITEFPFPNWGVPGYNNGLSGLAVGADGNLWFCKPCYAACDDTPEIVRLTPQGVATEFDVIDYVNPEQIVAAGDGNLWSIDRSPPNILRFIRIDLSGAMTVFDFLPYVRSGLAVDLTADADGNVWISESHFGLIGRLSPPQQASALNIFFPLIRR